MVAENLKLIITTEAGQAIGELKKFTGETNSAKAGVNKFQQNIAAWAKGMAAAYISVEALRRAIRYGFEASKVAAEAKQINTALDSMASKYGSTANEIISSLKRASGGTISELELMQSASKAALFDLPLNQLDRLMEIARASATATGQSMQYMFDSIVTGIARGSPMILDNLGLTLKIGEATEKYAQSIGKTTEQLTAEERKMATLNATLEAGGKIIEKVNSDTDELTALQKWQRYEATMKDLRLEVGKYLQPAFEAVTDTANRFATKLKDIVELRNIMREVSDGTATTADKLRALNIQLKQANEQYETAARIDPGGSSISIIRERIDALKKQQEWLQRAQAYEAMATTESYKAAAAAREAAEQESKRAEQALALQAQIDKAYAKTEPGARAALEAQIAMWEGILKSAGDAGPKVVAIIAGLREELASMDEKVEETADETEAAMSRIQAAFADMGRAVSPGVMGAGMSGLVGTLSDIGNVGGAALGDVSDAAKILFDEMWELRDANDAFFASFSEGSEGINKAGENLRKIERQAREMYSVISPITEAFGAMAVGSEDAAERMKNAIRGAIAKILEMLALEAFSRAAAAAVPGPTFNPAAAAGYAAAGVAASIAAGAVKAMAQGGIVTRPTMALVGERGPEAVIPLNRAGGMGPTVIVNVQGSVLEEEGLARRITRVMEGAGRGY